MATDPPYRAIADRLRAQIQAGDPVPADALPPAKELAEQFGVSRTTVHKAFAVLQDEGLLDIRAGVGVFVRAWRPVLRDANARVSRKQWKRGHSIWHADIGDREMHVEATVRTVKAAEVPAEVRGLLDAPRYLVRERVFTVDRQRVQLAASYLDAALVGGTQIAEVDTGPGGTFARLAELGHEPRRFCEDIRARFPAQAERDALGIGPRRIVLEVLRENATEQERVVEVTHMLMVADCYVLRYHFTS